MADSEDERQLRPQSVRNSYRIALTELPELKCGEMSWQEQVWDELQFEYWRHHPINEYDNLNEEQLAEVYEWSKAVKSKLSEELAELQTLLESEWLAKEQMLDQLFTASIGQVVR